jgi:hypothetical protein
MDIEKRKSLTVLQPIIRTAYNTFKEDTASLVIQIKNIKDQAIGTIKSTDEYKTANNIIKKLTGTRTKLLKKYPTRRNNIPLYYSHFRKKNLSRELHYKFRVKRI